MSPLAQVLAVANRPPQAPPQATVAPTNVAGIYANNDAQNMDAYKAQIAQQNAQWGALASLGGAGINAFAPGAGSALKGGFGGGSGGGGTLMSGAGNGAGGYPYMMF